MVPFRVDQEGLREGSLHVQNLGGQPERANLRGPQDCATEKFSAHSTYGITVEPLR